MSSNLMPHMGRGKTSIFRWVPLTTPKTPSHIYLDDELHYIIQMGNLYKAHSNTSVYL